MKTAVSIPDALFEQAEKIARKLRKTRSQVYREALSEYLSKRTARSVTDEMNEALAEIDQTPDPFLREATRSRLEQAEW
jgi:antitoxin MazE6